MQTVHNYPESARQSEEVTVGTVWTETLAQATTPPMLVNRAHFSPGARTCWHEHIRGQTLLSRTVSLLRKHKESRSKSCELGRPSFASQVSGTGTAQHSPTP